MHAMPRRLTRWLYVLMVFSLLGSTSPPVPPTPGSQLGGDPTHIQFYHPPAYRPQPISEIGKASKAAGEAAIPSEDHLPAQARAFTPRALPVTFTLDQGVQLQVSDLAPKSPKVLSNTEGTEADDLGAPSSPSVIPSPEHTQVAQATSPSGFMFIENVGQFDFASPPPLSIPPRDASESSQDVLDLLYATFPGGVGRTLRMPLDRPTDQVALTAPGEVPSGLSEELSTQGCEAYPIAIQVEKLIELQPGDSMYLWNNYDDFYICDFGWLRWSPDYPNGSVSHLIQEIYNPSLAITDFQNAKDPSDTTLGVGDWVWVMYGVNPSSSIMHEAMDYLVTLPEIRVLVYDVFDGPGFSFTYHIVDFAMVRITDYEVLPAHNVRIAAQFLGWDNACPGTFPDLAIAKSVVFSSVPPGHPLTYTLTFTNAGLPLATGVVITDMLPITLTNVGFTCSGAAITPTAGITYAWRVQDLGPNEGGIITVTGEVSAGLAAGFTFTNTAIITGTRAESDIANNSSAAMVFVGEKAYLPVVFKQP